LICFVDGVCVLHPGFKEGHWKMMDEKSILAGKRIKLDPETSHLLISGNLKPDDMNSRALTNFSKIKKQGGAFFEEGIFINYSGILGFLTKVRKCDTSKDVTGLFTGNQ